MRKWKLISEAKPEKPGFIYVVPADDPEWMNVCEVRIISDSRGSRTEYRMVGDKWEDLPNVAGATDYYWAYATAPEFDAK